MLTVFNPKQLLHTPQHELSDGKLIPAVETAQRAEAILEAIKQQSLGDIVYSKVGDLSLIRTVHCSQYLEFLANVWKRSQELGRSGEVFPFVWPIRGMRTEQIPSHLDGQLGYYSFDAGTPIGQHSYEAALSGAFTVLHAVELLLKDQNSVYALCRPPGHHAAYDYFGGYCFLNNVAIAAQRLRNHGLKKITILDIDYHHGNGTQSIFYDRADVQFVSIHADPSIEFPYFLGYADEIGEGDGIGFNVNYPLPFGTDWEKWSVAFEDAVKKVLEFRPEVLLISLGLDCFEKDPISQFRLKSDDFRKIGTRLSQFGLPTLFVQEGGYAVEELGENCLNVLTSFEGS